MNTALNLLRMLEPAIRPAGSPARAVQPIAPIEHRPFDQLLAEAQKSQDIDPDQQELQTQRPSSPRAALSGVARVENSSLRVALEAADATNRLNRISDPQAEPRVREINQG